MYTELECVVSCEIIFSSVGRSEITHSAWDNYITLSVALYYLCGAGLTKVVISSVPQVEDTGEWVTISHQWSSKRF